jgi:hypothetical protein
MSDYSVTLLNDKELLKRLDNAVGIETLRDGLNEVGLEFQTAMKVYPPVPPGSTFQRTMTIRNKWTREVASDGSQVVVGNNAERKGIQYAPYVQGREKQAKWHQRNGWSTAEGTLQLNLDRYKKILLSFIKGALNGK